MSRLTDLNEKRDQMQAELDGLAETYRDAPEAGVLTRMNNLKTGIVNVREEILTEAATRPENREESSAAPPAVARDRQPGGEDREAALRAIEARSDDLESRAGDRLEALVRRDAMGMDARYITAVSSDAYYRAFFKQLSGGQGAGAVLEPDEVEAMRAVGRSMHERAMAVGTGELGGFAVPFTLDPTILLTNDGAINPIRELATVTTILSTTWQGISSAGVEAEFTAEATEAKDGAPKIGQPEITPDKAQIWVPYSIELGADWVGVGAELARLFADAKAVKEAEVFATGKGTSNVPQGMVSGATKLVETATKEVVVGADVYKLQEALAPRFQPRATFLGTNTVANQIHRFVAKGDTEDAALMSDDRKSILGKPYAEVSTMSSKTTTKKERVLAYADVAAGYRIVDRLGLTVEQVQHVFGANQRPTGERGLYAYFRVGADLVVPEAVQVLVVKE
jgi:HK97 family phage major capsid protein